MRPLPKYKQPAFFGFYSNPRATQLKSPQKGMQNPIQKHVLATVLHHKIQID